MPTWKEVEEALSSSPVEQLQTPDKGEGAGEGAGEDGSGAGEEEEVSRGETAGTVPTLAIGQEKHFRAEKEEEEERPDSQESEPRQGGGDSSTAATTARTDSTSPSPSACSSSRASAAGDAQPAPPEGGEEGGGSPCGQGRCEEGDQDGSREASADAEGQPEPEELQGGPLFQGLWEDSEGDVIRVEGATLHGPDGELAITPVDERAFELDTGEEVFQAAVDESGRLVWNDGSSWARKEEQTTEATAEQKGETEQTEAKEQAEEEPKLGTKARWAQVTQDLHLFLAGPSAPAAPATPSEPRAEEGGEASAAAAATVEAAEGAEAGEGAEAARADEEAEAAPGGEEVDAEPEAAAVDEVEQAGEGAEAAPGSEELQAEPEVAAVEEVEQAPPLDPPPEPLEKLLGPLREQLLGSIAEKLAKYDGSYRYPRPEDTKTATRDGLEEYLLVEALKELRTAVRKEYNHGVVGQVWKVTGGKNSAGIIARVDDEVRSDKADSRLSHGALVEELAVKEERLKYRLISGSGPETAWVSTKVKAGFTGYRDLTVKVPPKALPASIAVLGLMAAHIRTQARLERFCHVLRSVQRQKLEPGSAEFLFAVSWSSTPELESKVRIALEEFTCSKDSPDGNSAGLHMFAVHQVERHSQFQHLKAALGLAEGRLRERWEAALGLAEGRLRERWEAEGQAEGQQRSVWVIFGDDDDIWHSSRVAEYVGAIRSHPLLDGVGLFITTARVNCSQNKRLLDKDMPITEEQVDTFIKSGQGVRMDKKDESTRWRTKYRSRSHLGNTEPVPVDLGLEYFDLCPRLRLVHEFFGKTSSDFLVHRYCDLTFNEFLTTYPLKGREMGLEVSFLFPACWMIFYATPIPDEKAWKGSVEKGLDANNGHMSSEYHVEAIERELARRSLEDFKEFEAITEEKLARYWAAYRAQLECYLVRKRGCKVDQRIFDCIVFLALNGSFFDFWDSVKRRARSRQQAAYDMMCYLGQGFAKAIASILYIDVLWLRPHLFLEPDGAREEAPSHSYGGFGAPWQQGFGKGPWGKYPPFTGPWSHGKGPGKGAPWGLSHGLNKAYGKGASGKGASPGGHAPVFFSPYSKPKPSHMQKKW